MRLILVKETMVKELLRVTKLFISSSSFDLIQEDWNLLIEADLLTTLQFLENDLNW